MSLLRERFERPPKAFSPVPIWWWSGDRLERERLRWQLERFAEGGVHNLVVLNLAPTSPMYGSDADDPPFLSDAWWEIFRGVCEDAKEFGIYLWFYDQLGFSGANVQGEIVKANPGYAGRSLERLQVEAEDEAELVVPGGGTPVGAAAIPIDDSGRPVGPPQPLELEGRRLRWRGNSRHRVMLFYSVERGFDYFNPEACSRLLDTVHGEFERRLGEFFGSVIVGSFQDELPSMPTWSEDFPGLFRQARGYDLVPRLAALWEDYGEEARKVRRDYHLTRAELAEQAFFRPLFEWHESRGLICGFDQQHPARAGYPLQSVSLYADYQRTHRWYGAPGSDHHGETKIHSSLAHLYGRPRVWLEAFHSSGWGGTLEETFDWLLNWLRDGATLYDPHAVYYSTHGGWWEWAPPATDWRQPYWRHYKGFAAAVARLCAVLSMGDHVCDVGLLFPASTVQANLGLGGALEDGEVAHDLYLQLVGKKHWYKMAPGLLDRMCLDYDVLDEESVARGEVREGRLRIGNESYSRLVLPNCTSLPEPVARKLLEFVEGGGELIALGRPPSLGAGMEDEDAVVRRLGEACARASGIGELERVLGAGRPLVKAPVATLVRRYQDKTVVYVPAAWPRATRMRSEEDEDGWSWLQVDYTFDPSRYAREMEVWVRGASGRAQAWDPYSGERREVETWEADGGCWARLRFAGSPALLLVWGEEDPALPEAGGTEAELLELGDTWEVELVHTLDNRWGDFDMPPGKEVPLQRWSLLHRAEAPGEDGLELGWQAREVPADGWREVHASFGPRVLWTGPSNPEDLPSPGSGGDGLWREAEYSLSRGIHKDPVHVPTLGPKGHVPEEFLDFGSVRAGQAVQLRTVLRARSALRTYLAVGAAAAKRAWLNGEEVHMEDPGYLAFGAVHLREGDNLLEIRLEAEEDVRLRAHFACVRDPQRYRRPEWMRLEGEVQKDSLIVFSKAVHAPDRIERAVLQVASVDPCRVRVNGHEVGRHGGFDPYFESDSARIRPYDLRRWLRPGENQIEIEVIDLRSRGVLLVDGLIEGGGERVEVISDTSWLATRDGLPARVVLRRTQWGDPGWTHLWRRPHPLRLSSWLENALPADEVEDLSPAVPGSGGRVEWLSFPLPPGARSMRLSLRGDARVFVDGQEVQPAHQGAGGSTLLEVELPRPEAVGRWCAVRVVTEPGHNGGAILDGPITFVEGPGRMRLGDWESEGLVGWSGGVTYRQTFSYGGQRGHVLLDLGRVRGTAEVKLNGTVIGARVWSPYRYELGDALVEGDNTLEITVYNTLAPYLDEFSPTHYVFPRQRVSGLFGPVRLLRG